MRWYEREQVKKAFLFTGIVTGVYLAMRFILPLVLPFGLGALLAMLLHPLVDRLAEKTGKSRGLAAAAVVFCVLAAVGTGCFFAGRAAWEQISSLMGHGAEIEEGMLHIWCGCCEFAEEKFGVRVNGAQQKFMELERKVMAGVRTKTLPYLLKNSVSYAKIVFSAMGVMLVSVISGMLILTDYPTLAKAARESEIGKLALRIKRRGQEAGGAYLKAQLIILLTVSGICIAGLFFTGNPYALLAGLGIGVCDALPFVGTGVGFVPWILIDIVNGKYALSVVYGLLYVLCSLARQFLEPRLIGKNLGYPPVLVLMSIYIGLHIYGGAGVLLGPISAFLVYQLYLEWEGYLQDGI